MNKHLLILITGAPAAGKTTVASMLAGRREVVVINVGDVLAEELTRRSIPFSTRGEVGPRFLNSFGRERVFDLVRERCVPAGTTVVDGIRLAVTCNQFLSSEPTTRIIWVEASDEIRRERRRAVHSAAGWSETASQEEWSRYRSYDSEYRDVKELAHKVILNNSSVEALGLRVESLELAGIGARPRE